MTGSTGNDLWHPTVEDVLMVHSDVIAEDEDAEPGVESEARIGYVIGFIQYGHFDEGPETIHEKAFHLMRLLASNHWFVDGNKRTALNTTELFYLVNGYKLEYGEDVRSILKLFSVRESLIDRDVGTAYLSDQAEPLDSRESPILTEALLAIADYLGSDLTDELPDEYLTASLRERLGLTIPDADGKINRRGDKGGDHDGG